MLTLSCHSPLNKLSTQRKAYRHCRYSKYLACFTTQELDISDRGTHICLVQHEDYTLFFSAVFVHLIKYHNAQTRCKDT